MERGADLEIMLPSLVAGRPAAAEDLVRLVSRMATAANSLSKLIGAPALGSRLGAATDTANSDGDKQRTLDLVAEDLFRAALRDGGVAAIFRRKPRIR